jgi:hypothetical protein
MTMDDVTNQPVSCEGRNPKGEGLVRLERGIIAFKKNGEILWFPEGNHGDCAYQRFIKTDEVKELSRLFAFPQDILEAIKTGDELAELKEWLEENKASALEDYYAMKAEKEQVRQMLPPNCAECGTRMEFHYSELYGNANGMAMREYHYHCPKCGPWRSR